MYAVLSHLFQPLLKAGGVTYSTGQTVTFSGPLVAAIARVSLCYCSTFSILTCRFLFYSYLQTGQYHGTDSFVTQY